MEPELYIWTLRQTTAQKVLRRFVSLRGYPSKLYSDNGAQLVTASQGLKNVTKFWDWEKLKSFGVMEGFEWNFMPADAPWQNGTSESLIRSVKRSLKAAIGESILTFSELHTALFEVANLINKRPIGRHPRSPEDGSYLPKRLTFRLFHSTSTKWSFQRINKSKTPF